MSPPPASVRDMRKILVLSSVSLDGYMEAPGHDISWHVVGDELHDCATVTDETWAALRARYDDAALVELVCLAGFYHLISYVCRAFGVQPETWAAPAPAA